MNGREIVRISTVFLLVLLMFSMVQITRASPGDSFEEAIELSIGKNEDTLSEGNYDIWYFFNANSSQGYQISLDGPANSDFDFNIVDENNSYIGGAYSGSYPDQDIVLGYDIYYIHLYAYHGFGTFTLDIIEYDIPPGSEPSNPIPLDEGTNQLHVENFNFPSIYYEFQPEETSFYKINLEVTSPSSISGRVSNDANSYSIHNSTQNIREGSTYVSGGEGNIIIEIFVNYQQESDDIMDFSIKIKSVTPPDASDPDERLHLAINTPQQVRGYGGYEMFFSFEETDTEYYSISIKADDYMWGNFELYSYYGQYGQFQESITKDTTIYFNSNIIQVYNFSLYFYEPRDSIEFTIEVTTESPPPGYSIDTPLEVSTSPVSSSLYRGRLSLQATLSEGNAYLLQYETDDGSEIEMNLRVVSYTENRYRMTNRGSSGELFFAADTRVVDISVSVYSFRSIFNSNITFYIEEIDTPNYLYQGEARIANLGDNQGEILHKGQPYWFEFKPERTETYSFDLDLFDINQRNYFEVWGPYNTVMASSGHSPIEVDLSSSQTYHVLVHGRDIGSFILQIFEGQAPREVREYKYSTHLQQGDFFEWQTEAYRNGEPINDEGYGPSNGTTVTIDVLQDAPVINYMEESWSDYFDFTSNRIQDFMDPNMYIAPVEIIDDGRIIGDGVDFLQHQIFGDEFNVEQTTSQVIFSQSESFEDQDLQIEIIYDSLTFNLVSFHVLESSEQYEVEFSIVLVESRISGPGEPDIEENEPAFELDFSTSIILPSLVLIFLVRKKNKAFSL